MDKNYLVTKSNYFIMNSSYDLSLEEQKLILTLASMVQPDDEEFKPYKFIISDFMKLLGIDTKTKYTQIPKITKELMKKVFEIKEGDTLIQTAWLSSAIYKKGSGMVELEFSPRLKPYMLKLGTLFTQYKLANILSMKSKYSPRIYEILKCNEFRKQGSIEIEISELRKLLKAEDIYPLYADFKRKIIKQGQKELKKLSDIYFDFEDIKTGRKVTSIRFYIHKNKIESSNKVNNEISIDSIKEVQAIVKENISDLEAKKILDAANGNIDSIKEKYLLAKDTNNIDNIVAWLIKAIKEDWKTQKRKIKESTFNNFKQRKYSKEQIKKMEDGLLGI